MIHNAQVGIRSSAVSPQVFSNCEAAQSRQVQVGHQMQKLVDAVSENIGLINSLVDRLTPVLSNALPECKQESNLVHQELVPLASAIKNEYDRLMNSNIQLSSVLQRLEI